MTAFVQGSHDYFVPVLPDRGPDGRGRAQTWDWPARVVELAPSDLVSCAPDAVILQRPHEYDLVREWMQITPGVDVPAIYVEHNAPQGEINAMRHPSAAWPGVHVVHVTNFNDLFWDCGERVTHVIEHGVVDPGYRYTGELPSCAVVINEPQRRARVTGTDLLTRFQSRVPVELFGMGAGARGGYENLPQAELHGELARRRVYLHPIRWTSLGLSLIEAMHLGMPIVALATTEVPEAVRCGTGIISTNVRALIDSLEQLLANPDRCTELGRNARAYARERYGLERFLTDWDRLLEEIVC
jgi:glycosyltransferase involved in cell wall biosynthesis